MNVSMSRKGNYYDNACVESFLAILRQNIFIKMSFMKKSKFSKLLEDI